MKKFKLRENKSKRISEIISLSFFIFFLLSIISIAIFINLDKFISEEKANKIWNNFYNVIYDIAFNLSDENGKIKINSTEFLIEVNKLNKINYDENEDRTLIDGIKVYMNNTLENYIEIKQTDIDKNCIFLSFKSNIDKIDDEYIYRFYVKDVNETKNNLVLVNSEGDIYKDTGEYYGYIYIKNLELNKQLYISRQKAREILLSPDAYEEVIFTIPIA